MRPSLRAFLRKQDILKAIYHFAKKRKLRLFLVGGILRDIFLGMKKESPDFDFCLKRRTISFGKKLAREIKAGFVILDKEHGACRLVKKIKDKVYTFDFTDFRGNTLEEDLLHRDFTINAMALELEKIFIQPPRTRKGAKYEDLDSLLVDPYCAREDLKSKTIRMINKKVFVEDPLRILRAFSFASVLGFNIDKETLRLARSKKEELSKVSSERIRDELFKVLGSPRAFKYLVMTDKLKILKIIFPEFKNMQNVKQGPYHHLDVWQHTLETVRQLELLFKNIRNNKEVLAYLKESISGDRSRCALLKLGALLHDTGKPSALRHEGGKTTFHGHERIGVNISEEIGRRLKLSCDEINALRKIALWHLRPGYLADNNVLTRRAIFRYFRDTGSEAVSILLLSIADQRATKGPLTSRGSRVRHEKIAFGLIKEYFKRKLEKKMPRLISGDDLIKKFKLEPSPLIGRILSEVEELQAIGKIKTKPEALKVAAQIIKSRN